MAERKPLFMSSEGFGEEMSTSDSITLGGLTATGNISMGSAAKVIGANAATASGDVLVYGQTGASVQNLTISGTVSNDTHIASKEYVDTVMVTGGSVREPVLDSWQITVADGIRAAALLTLQSQAANDDRVILTDGTTTRTYYFGTGTGDVSVTIGADIAASMTNLANAIYNDGSAIWGALYRADYADSIDADGAILIWEDATSGTAPRVYGENWNAGECQVVDFTGEVDYSKKTLSDIPSSDPVTSNFGFRRTAANLTQGEMHLTLIGATPDILWYWDADAPNWQRFNSTNSINDATAASGGGTKGKATFDTDYGLNVQSGVVAVKLASSTNPGLEFSSGELKIKIQTTDQLSLDANGLNVEGVASSFYINAVATNGTYVTAANLDDLTDGSNGDSLHAHTGTSISVDHSDLGSVTANQHHNQVHSLTGSDHTESGLTTGHVLTATGATTFAWQTPAEAEAGQKVENTFVTQTDTTANGDPVYANANDKVGKADASVEAKAQLIGVIRSGGGAAGSSVEVVTSGPCAGVLSGATANTPYYLAVGGGLSTSLPAEGNRVILVGYALNATDLYVRLVDYGESVA